MRVTMEHLELRGITQQKSDTRRKHVAHATRMIQSEGLQPTARMLALDQQYISGEIGFTEYTRIQLAWD